MGVVSFSALFNASARARVARHHAHAGDHDPRADGPGDGGDQVRPEPPAGPARRRRQGADAGDRDRGRRRRRRARGGHRGHAEGRRRRGPRGAVSRDRHGAHVAQARRLAVRAVPGRDADRQRDGLLREGDRAGGRAGAVHPAHHLERRQLRLAGHHAGHPRDGAGRGPPARLVPRRPARVRGGRWAWDSCWP